MGTHRPCVTMPVRSVFRVHPGVVALYVLFSAFIVQRVATVPGFQFGDLKSLKDSVISGKEQIFLKYKF